MSQMKRHSVSLCRSVTNRSSKIRRKAKNPVRQCRKRSDKTADIFVQPRARDIIWDGGWATRSSVEPFICIDRHVCTTADYNFSQVPPVTEDRTNPGARLEHMRPVRQGRGEGVEKKHAHLSISIGVSGVSTQWQIVRKVWFITRIAPGVFVLGDVTKCDIIARR